MTIRGFVHGCFRFLLFLLALFLVFSVILWGMARYWWGYGVEDVTFVGLVWMGLVRFWLDGPGWHLAGACFAVGLFFALEWISGLLNLKAKQQAAGHEIEKRAAALSGAMRSKIEAEVVTSLEREDERLSRWCTQLAVEHREVKNREEKVDAYLGELKALRSQHAHYEFNRLAIRHKAQQALEALTRETPCIGEAKRLLKKIVKLA